MQQNGSVTVSATLESAFALILLATCLSCSRPPAPAEQEISPASDLLRGQLQTWVDDLTTNEVLVLGNESMPFCGREKDADVGMAIDILEAATRAGAPVFRFKVGLPWERAQAMVHLIKGAPIAIIPLTRTSAREGRYAWIAELISHDLHLHTYRRASTLESVEEALPLHVSIIRGSAHIPLLEQVGFTRINEARNAEVNARMLAAGRFDVMAESQWVNTYVWRKTGHASADLQIGPVVGETHYIYVAASTGFPRHLSDRIHEAVQQVRRSGELERIYDRWR